MTHDLVAGLLIGGGVGALLAYGVGVREGIERASRMWRGR